jgi:hypothetical protein
MCLGRCAEGEKHLGPSFPCRFAPQNLLPLSAAALLRFQRLEQQKAEGEARLHAPQSGAAQTRLASERLAVEQLVAL